MNHGSLFSGIGGFDLAAEWMGWNNIFHCEFDKEKQIQLKSNFKTSITYGDITQTDFNIHRGCIDIITGGFPCQDASIAKQDGKGQQGLQGNRTGLFFEMCRSIKEVNPKYVVAENVANILKTNGGADFTSILSELSSMGYNAEWRVCRASEVGAPHHRARLYIVAYPSSIRLQQSESFFSYVEEEITPFCWMPYGTPVQISRGGFWNSQPPILCLDDGVSTKLVRKQIHGYGNAIVPQIAYKIFKAIEEYERINSRTDHKGSHANS
jgi:DNA (cytosine-5)-methyltransferase 1